METVFILFKTDAWHSFASRDLIGIFESKELLIDAIKEKAKKEGQKLSQDDIFNLNNISQTQGYSGEGEFDFDEIEINTLI
jgi:hypothetical protein